MQNTIQNTMRKLLLSLITLLIVGLNFVSVSHAQDYNNGQTSLEQQRIREMRLLEWYAQQQQAEQGVPQSATQNVSGNQPYNAPRAPAPVATPEADDLFAAANAGNVNQLRTLLSQGLDINVSNRERETALHMAAARGHYSAVIFLVNKGAYVNAPTVKNWIPLHHAVRFRHPNIVNFLINHGSSPQSRTSDGLTAVDMARNVNDYRLLSILGAR
ncbi:ankyrin repeat domain-containing protein [Cocleimonas sp. KMM 6892]|uniref:ankyrin repeat domain-containing protein n=1 Tax=unclassified Cocleimonas TaxID=2639732 RepID=UPI002DB7FE1A|nr:MULTISPECIES: ankyrin repeat domain-containing protein [unclassified Cocleimonas]MEB8431275.1 ankyrin repeat domain-containing protein [Cocleimonas sp. KMM 6892]MEC4713953.1 ankyrin repeat domain-containing protein [Cocleimonas sp. KMM 6895]MEC4743284.1 ankyrin repeat domain-containing protein [Cocleimonas sp. KMM 6896]